MQYIYVLVKKEFFTIKDIYFLENLLHDAICLFIANYGIGKSYFFPVERSSMYTFANELGQNKLKVLDEIESLNYSDGIEFKIEENSGTK